MSDLCEFFDALDVNHIVGEMNYKNSLITNLISQVAFLKNEIREKNFIIRHLLRRRRFPTPHEFNTTAGRNTYYPDNTIRLNRPENELYSSSNNSLSTLFPLGYHRGISDIRKLLVNTRASDIERGCQASTINNSDRSEHSNVCDINSNAHHVNSNDYINSNVHNVNSNDYINSNAHDVNSNNYINSNAYNVNSNAHNVNSNAYNINSNAYSVSSNAYTVNSNAFKINSNTNKGPSTRRYKALEMKDKSTNTEHIKVGDLPYITQANLVVRLENVVDAMKKWSKGEVVLIACGSPRKEGTEGTHSQSGDSMVRVHYTTTNVGKGLSNKVIPFC